MSPVVWAIVVAGGVITFVQRFSFLGIAERATHVSPRVRESLRMIPAAALAALVAPAVFRSGPEGAVDLLDPRVLAAILALAVMWRTRQVLVTLIVGLGVVIVFEQLL